MISFDCALTRIRQAAVTLGTEHVTLRAALQRVLAWDVLAGTNMPPFDKSAMDGYACRRADLHKALRVIATIHAGALPTVRRLGPGQCAKIMTGAMVPAGA
ncbi:MAG: molybdenum cofactor guanylyltransferase, partial [bacterium]|nr:molybdenum cofactor guanylyltransferase [bacterium]